MIKGRVDEEELVKERERLEKQEEIVSGGMEVRRG